MVGARILFFFISKWKILIGFKSELWGLPVQEKMDI